MLIYFQFKWYASIRTAITPTTNSAFIIFFCIYFSEYLPAVNVLSLSLLGMWLRLSRSASGSWATHRQSWAWVVCLLLVLRWGRRGRLFRWSPAASSGRGHFWLADRFLSPLLSVCPADWVRPHDRLLALGRVHKSSSWGLTSRSNYFIYNVSNRRNSSYIWTSIPSVSLLLLHKQQPHTLEHPKKKRKTWSKITMKFIGSPSNVSNLSTFIRMTTTKRSRRRSPGGQKTSERNRTSS